MLAFAAICAIAVASPVFAQTGTMPAPASVGGGLIAPPAPSGSGAMRAYESPVGDGGAPATSTHRSTHHQTVKHHSSADSSAVEPAQGHLKLIENSWAYQRPSKLSKKIEPVQAGKFVNVIGTSRYYAQVKLKSSEIAYVPLTAIQVVSLTDKTFKLTADAPVRTSPNHAAKRLAEVHQGRDVHVVGIALNYMKIRMKDSVEGYIPISALQ